MNGFLTNCASKALVHASLAISIILISPHQSVSQWTDNIYSHAPVCLAEGDQVFGQVTTDGAGGGIAVWTDYRSGTGKVYLQKLNGFGFAAWSLNGIPIAGTMGVTCPP
jgi:hypothetical protein